MGGVYRKSFLEDHHIQFPENIVFCEDLVFNYLYDVYFTKSIKIDGVTYYYRKRENSLTNGYSLDRQIKNYNSTKNMIHVFEQYKLNGVFNEPDTRRSGDRISLDVKILQVHEATLNWLATIGDINYVRKQLAQLRDDGIYPYPFIKDTLRGQGIRGVLMYFLPYKPVFWVLWILYRFKNRWA